MPHQSATPQIHFGKGHAKAIEGVRRQLLRDNHLISSTLHISLSIMTSNSLIRLIHNYEDRDLLNP